MRIKIWKKAVLIVFLLLTVISTKERSKAAVNNEQTDTKKVAIDDTVAIADASKYKDMDYSFLKTMEYAKSLNTDTVFTDVNQMKIASLKEGQKVKTKGYYSSGDQGAACYQVSKTFEKGGVKLNNGLFANIMPDSYVDKNGTKWLIANVRQFGGKGDAIHEDHEAINFAVARVGKLINETKDTGASRGIIYLPEGEYKLGYGIEVGYSNLNFVGEGDKSIIVTDNDYRDEEGYSEFLFTCWGCKNMYFGNFRIEAREVDLYHYMRQFVVVYSQNVYVYKVNLIIPQSTYNSYYFEDKQYSNFCCYSGNKDVTVDDCIMEQMSGTYRGANLGILDIWAAGEENITVMNCDFYGNARDEQIGFFSKNDPNASVKHVDFINNTMHSAQLRYVDIIGNRTMCFTVAYADSQNIDDIRIAGNHFICESDSKFMTLGEMKNCKFEDNILEIKCTYQSWSMLFDSANSSPDNILVRNNDIFITSDFGIGRGNITGGNLTLSNNRILFDTQLVFGVYGPEIHNNKIIGLAQCGTIGMDS
ncbi:MAG: glycoside hydrolase family 55 protein, partial [Lachnospiraceae bacterium]|nr:glycoside hydrolase family 55 protein [Lachnospiraceae bacterium]